MRNLLPPPLGWLRGCLATFYALTYQLVCEVCTALPCQPSVVGSSRTHVLLIHIYSFLLSQKRIHFDSGVLEGSDHTS